MRLEAWQAAALVFPALVLFHLSVSPYTKVEESFNIQATHDILSYGIPTQNVFRRFKAQFDHMTFPGAVPRTFIGALVLSGVAKPFNDVFKFSLENQQFLVRAILGLFNALALFYYTYGVRRAFGKTTALWYTLFQASQFHIFYYASRTLPNMFAFCLSTIATRFLLPDPTSKFSEIKRTRLALYILTLTTVVFRAELALVLVPHIFTLMISTSFNTTSIRTLLRTTIIPPLIAGTVAGLALTVPIDTYFWCQSFSPFDYVWPELSAFLLNIFPNLHSTNPSGASAWGTSPWYWYFASAIPRLFFNPFLLMLAAASVSPYFPHLRPTAQSFKSLVLPYLQFTILYSFLPHKETRFIFPIIPPLTAALAISASRISDRRTRNASYNLFTQLLIISTLLTALFSHAILLPLSALTYPGAHALTSLHNLSSIYAPQREIHVHISNLALQTGVTQYLYQPIPKSPLVILPGSPDGSKPTLRSGATRWFYDKSESHEYLDETWWRAFDYVIVEGVENVRPLGGWDVVDTIYGLGRPVLIRGNVGRGLLVFGDETQNVGVGVSGRRYPDGIMRVLSAMYGDGVLGRSVTWVYGVLHDVLREGYGMPWRSLTGGYWVHWNMERRLFVMKRSPNVAGTRRYTPFRPAGEGERMGI